MPLDPHTVYVYDGPMETRIEYGTDLKLDKEMSIFALCDSPEGREVLIGLYRMDVKAALPHRVPIILNAPTYRASSAHTQRMGYTAPGEIARVNRACVELIAGIREEFQDDKELILLTAPVGPKHAGYHPGLEFTVDMAAEYHREQAETLAALPLDLISIAAMPGAAEAHGAARAISASGRPYTVGFILNAEGDLLDGTSVRRLIDSIDNDPAVATKPLFYVIGCTHVSVAAGLLAKEGQHLHRLQGIKANGSSLSPEELMALDHAAADEPDRFAADLLALGRPHHFRVYGGCCGTDVRHVESLCRGLSRQTATSRTLSE
jgi:homocysteine S-methyltransferase